MSTTVKSHNRAITRRVDRRVARLALGILVPATAIAGPCWEDPPFFEAGPLPLTAQITTGSGPLTCINGRLGTGTVALGLDDSEDMFLIFIEDPAAFLASTSPEFGGAAEFPTALWLFSTKGKANLANRAFAPTLAGSRILPEANDGTGFILTAPGYYYLAITAASSMPLSQADGLPMFQFDDPFEVSGPDGPGADFPITAWATAPADGTYTIILAGTSFAARPCAGDLNLDGTIDAIDLGILLNNFGCGAGVCTGDINDDGIIDAIDLGILLNNFGTQCGPFGACCLPDGTCDFISVYECLQGGGYFQAADVPCNPASCPPPPPINCCTPQKTPGCGDPACEAAVCSIDPFCCAVIWDTLCVSIAAGNPDCGCN